MELLIIKKRLLLLFVVFTTAINAVAYDFGVKNSDGVTIYYNKLSDGSASVTYETSSSHSYVGRVVVPASVTNGSNTYAVTAISTNAFSYCTGLTEVLIPSTVTQIGDKAFQGCSSLTSVVIPASVTSIGMSAFHDCSNLKEVISLNTTPPTLSGNFCFPSAAKVKVRGSSVEKYKAATYWSAYSSNIVSADSQIIYYTSSDGEAVTPSATDAFGANYLQSTCTDGQGIILFDNVITTIGAQAFDGCTGLTSVAIPESVTTIGKQVFNGCTGLTAVTIPESVTTIGEQAFNGCTALTSVDIPESVTSIAVQAFKGCTALTTVTIPESVSEIGSSAFYGCSSLKEAISLNTTPATLGSSCFSNVASGFKVKVRGASVDTYKEATNWRNYTIVSADNQIIYYTSSNGNVVVPYATDVFGATLKSNSYKDGLGMLVFDGDVTTIGYKAFYYCFALTSVVIPGNVTSIEAGAFCFCSYLTSVTMGSAVTEIGDEAFINCEKLTSIMLPASITRIGNYAFSYCYALTSMVIPSSVTSIGYDCFSGCIALSKVYCLSTNPPTLGRSCFNNVSNDLVVKVKGSQLGNYKAADGWQECSIVSADNQIIYYTSSDGNAVTPYNAAGFDASIIYNSYHDTCKGVLIFGSDLTTIASDAFQECTTLTSVSIPASVTSMKGNAFYKCNGLQAVCISDLAAWCRISFGSETSNPLYYAGNLYLDGTLVTEMTIPASVTKIASMAFYWCASLTSVTIPASVTTIGNKAFYYCYNLTSVTMKDGLSEIKPAAFYNCYRLTSVTLPSSVTTIADYAFDKCSSLEEVTLLATTAPTIFSDTFRGTSSKLTLKVPGESIADYRNASVWKTSYINKLQAISLALTDDAAYTYDFNFVSGLTTYTRNVSHNNWHGFYLPFDVDVAVLSGTCATLTSVSDNTLNWETQSSGTISAGTPFIYKPSATGDITFSVTDATTHSCTESHPAEIDGYTLSGTYTTKSDMGDTKAYALSAGNFYYTTNNSKTLKPYRIYLTVPESVYATARICSRIDGEDVTGVVDIDVDIDLQNKRYNLLGQPVGSGYKGIVIVNGKKILRK